MENSFVYMLGFVMIVVGSGFLWMLFKGRKPADVIEWAGAILSILLIASAAAMMLIATGDPISPGSRVATPSVFEDMVMEVPASDFQFYSVDDGSSDSLSRYMGKVVIVNFWGTWCAPCLEEIPALNRLQGEYAGDGLVILSVSDEPAELLQSFERQVPLETVSVRMEAGAALPAPFTGGMNIRPASYIIDRDGVARRYLLGNRSYSFFRNAIEPFL